MAQFNPKTEAFNPRIPDEQAPNFLGYSQGIGTNKQWGTLFEGLGNVVDAAAKGGDMLVQESLSTDARAGVNEVRSLFGDDPDTVSQLTGASVGIDKAGSRLSRLSKAYAAGAITDSHYYANLDAVVKNLRVKYPGYDDQIDTVIQNLTGVDPANALINSIQADAKAGRAAQDKEKQNLYQFEVQHMAEIKTWMPNYFDLPESERPDPQQMYAGAANVIAQNEDIKNKISQLTLADKQGELSDVDRFKGAQDVVATTMSQILNGGLNGGISGGGDLNTVMEKLDKFRETGTPPSPEEQAQLQNMAANLHLQIAQTIPQRLGDVWYKLSEPQRKDLMASATTQVDNIIDAINNPNYGVLAANTAAIKASQDAANVDLMRRFPPLLKLGAIKEFGGDGAVSVWTSKHMDVIDQITGLGISERAGKFGAESINTTFDRLSHEDNVSKSIFSELLEAGKTYITDPDIPEQTKLDQTKWLFGPEGLKLEQFSKDDQVTVFNKLVTPDVTAKIKEMSGNNDQLWTDYSSWVYRNFSGLYKQLASDIKAFPKSSIDLLTFAFDEGTGQIVATPKTVSQRKLGEENQARAKSGLEMLSQTNIEMTQGDVLQKFSDLNRALASMKPLLEGDNLTVGEGVGTLLQQLGILSAPIPAEEGNSRKGPDERSENLLSGVQLASLSPDDQTMIDQIGVAEGADYNTFSGGSDQGLSNLTVGEVQDLQKNWKDVPGAMSSAAGKPQIMADTMQWLISNGTLDKDEKFDKEAQDRATLALLHRRGYGRYKAGKMTPDQFLENIAQEWASIPNSSGESAYAGDGLNNATVGGRAIARLIAGG